MKSDQTEKYREKYPICELDNQYPRFAYLRNVAHYIGKRLDCIVHKIHNRLCIML